MRKITLLKLGTVCTDKATGLTGTLTHWVCNTECYVEYLFQPEGVSPDSGQPLPKIKLELGRLETDDKDCFEDVKIPVEILGSQVTDKASGFKGMAVGFVRHINGCFHVIIQPAGSIARTKAPIMKNEFDLRGCIGEKIREITTSERLLSEIREPSPNGSLPEDHIPCHPSGALD